MLNNRLQAWWRLEGTGNDALGVYNGTVTGAIAGAAKFGRGYTFDGTDDDITLPANSNLLRNVSGWTFAAWAQQTATATNKSLFQASVNAGTSSRGWVNFTSLEKLECRASAADGETAQIKTANSASATGTWLHVGVVVDYANDTITLYVNGVAVASTGTISFTATSTSDTTSDFGNLAATGSGGAGNFLNGKIDEAVLIPRALPESDIRRLMLGLHPLH